MDLLALQWTSPLLLTAVSFLGGILAGFLAKKRLDASPAMMLTVMVLPSVVCAALLAINGSLGAGIAILGVFGLVRFRSLPGAGTDIVAVFYAMVIGLVFSTGFVIQGILLILLLAIVIWMGVGIVEKMPKEYTIHIVVPEDEGDLERFTKIMERHGRNVKLDRVRTTNMGSMYELVYQFELTGTATQLLDDVRMHNHNLNVSLHTSKTEAVL